MKGYWFRILPIDDDKDGAEAANELDITHMTHFQWETLLPVLLYIGLIGFRVTSVVHNGFVIPSQWDELAKSMKTKHQIDLHVTPIRRKGKKRVYYICLGNPHYKNPSLQKQALIFLQVQQQKKDQQEWLVLVTGGATTTTKTRSTIYFSSKNTATTRRSVCVCVGCSSHNY